MSAPTMPRVIENLPSHATENYRLIVGVAAAATAIAVAALFLPWEFIRIIGMTVVVGVTYGIANDMVACRDCIEYFTSGHIYDGRKLDHRLIRTLNPTLNALTWGAVATWHVCALAGLFFAFLARCPLLATAVKISAAQLAPYLAIGAAVTLLVSHLNSRWSQQQMEKAPYVKYAGVPLTLQAGWEACNVRNSTGYASIGIGGALLSIAMIAARAGLLVL